jgi:hypothetical protein
MMTRGTRYALAVVALLIMLTGAVAGSFALSEWTVARSQRQWCETLTLITSVPVPAPADPAANPSREGQYRLYEDFLQVQRRFGCHPGT